MKDRYVKLQIEGIVNKLLFDTNVIEKTLFEETQKKIDRLMFEEEKNNSSQN